MIGEYGKAIAALDDLIDACDEFPLIAMAAQIAKGDLSEAFEIESPANER